MGRTKNYCRKCLTKHYPPTGKKCPGPGEGEPAANITPARSTAGQDRVHQATSEQPLNMDSNHVTPRGATMSLHGAAAQGAEGLSHSARRPQAAQQSDCNSFGGSELSQPRGSSCRSGAENGQTSDVQMLILQELSRVNRRLDAVEEKAAQPQHAVQRTKLSRTLDPKFYDNQFSSLAQSSDTSDSEDTPDLDILRESKSIQQKVDKRLSSLKQQQASGVSGIRQIKSARGGDVDVLIKQKVAWPHEAILGGVSRQRLSYDQLSLPQFVQGFVRNMLSESNLEVREKCYSIWGT